MCAVCAMRVLFAVCVLCVLLEHSKCSVGSMRVMTEIETEM